MAQIFSGTNRQELPVVSPEGQLLGVVRNRHLLEAYNRELMKRDMVSGLGSSLAATATDEVPLGEDYRMADLDAPGEFLIDRIPVYAGDDFSVSSSCASFILLELSFCRRTTAYDWARCQMDSRTGGCRNGPYSRGRRLAHVARSPR